MIVLGAAYGGVFWATARFYNPAANRGPHDGHRPAPAARAFTPPFGPAADEFVWGGYNATK